ncbi:MAG: hypothetical protein BMS9Abin39_0317 [Ignavibacteria bacterium]|nr:MAG: hypothetical protein BMS9Abin39_0317 [Ignavibacteria bacterium]
MHINNVTYCGGMIEKLSDKNKLDKIVFSEDEIPQNILYVIDETQIIDISSVYSDEKVGVPIQYDLLSIEFDNTAVTIEAFNIIILIIKTNDPYIKRVFKVIAQFKRIKHR